MQNPGSVETGCAAGLGAMQLEEDDATPTSADEQTAGMRNVRGRASGAGLGGAFY